jgi:hypothetical protein
MLHAGRRPGVEDDRNVQAQSTRFVAAMGIDASAIGLLRSWTAGAFPAYCRRRRPRLVDVLEDGIADRPALCLRREDLAAGAHAGEGVADALLRP